MNKILAIGDLHGLNIWEKIISQENDYDNIVFLGDYFDSSKISGEEQIKNFENIIKFKNANNKKVDILLGNHELQYLVNGEQIKGYQKDFAQEIKKILEENIDLLSIVKVINNIIFSHRGFSKTWLNNLAHFNFDIADFENEINNLFFGRNGFKAFKKPFLFYDWDDSAIGYALEQGPMWIRPGILCNNMLDNFIQVVGHSYIPIEFRGDYNDKGLYLADNISINKDEESYYLRILKDEFSFKIKEIVIN